LLRPLGHVRARFQRWWQARLPQADTLALTQRNVYILPTKPGLMLAGTLVLLLVASINYQLNLGYLLTFLLAGSAAAGMHISHATLRGLVLTLAHPEPCFAGSAAPLEIRLTSSRKRARHGIGMAVLDTQHWSHTDVPADGESILHVAFSPQRRGLHKVPTLTAETRFPLGTFRVWAIWRPAAEVLVYPAAEINPPPLPPGEPRSGGAAAASATATTGEFDGVRVYRRGDPMKLVVWKKAARAFASGSGELVSRDSQQARRHELWLDHATAGAGDPEHRLSRLCAWVLMADRSGEAYGLRLPGIELKPDTGETHRRRCLEALALW
jgi:uncharacterized protein (DUF58 family)